MENEYVVNTTEIRDNDINANIDNSRVWAGTQLIGLPKCSLSPIVSTYANSGAVVPWMHLLILGLFTCKSSSSYPHSRQSPF
ncbi:hypothetical protein CBL_10332 [Carabus blaptoides fortunei]